MSLQEQMKWGTLAESEGALKYTELLHIKTEIVRLQIMRNFKNSAVFMSTKRHKGRQRFLAYFVCGP